MIFFSIIFFSANDSKSKQLRPKPRIVGGRTSPIEQYPYLVEIELDFDHHCGGSIISPYVIVTAAHCFHKTLPPKRYQVRAGSSLRGRGGSVHYVENFIQHPEYQKGGSYSHDLAILKLENPIKLDNKTKKSIKMFESGEEIKHGAKAVTAGWGRLSADGPGPDELQSLQLVVVGKKDCSKIWSDFFFKEGMICATSPNDNVIESSCHGDSGGPLIVNDTLAGVVSFGSEGCINKPSPEIYAEIAYMRDWIDKEFVKISEEKVSLHY